MTANSPHRSVVVAFLASLLAVACGGESVDGSDLTGAIEQGLAPPGSGATYVSDTLPRSLYPGERRRIEIVLKNTGAASPENDWTKEAPAYKLRSNWDSRDTPLSGIVPVGSSSTFSFVVTAPSASGVFSARMSAVGLGAFGVDLKWPVEIKPTVEPSWRCTFVPESSTLPSTLAPGESRAIYIMVRNAGSSTWPAAAVGLASMDTPASAWGQTVTPLLDDAIAPGGLAGFSLVIRAPNTLGPHTFLRELIDYRADGVGAFRVSDFCVNLSIDVGGAPPLDAKTAAQNFPTIMAPGETKSVTVTMINTGTSAWKNDGTFRLSSTSTPVSLWGLTQRGVGNEVPPNSTASFTFAVRAPTTPGTYHHLWRMRETAGENPGVFGDLIDVPVEVNANVSPEFGARVVSQDIPLRMTAGNRYSFSITMQNTGTASWSGSDFSLNSTNEPSSIWGVTNSALAAGETVAPGQSRTFNLPVRAPYPTGSYSSSWRMRTSSVGRFGDTASTPEIVVFNSSTPPFDAAVVSSTLPSQLISGLAYSVSVTMRNTGMYDWSGSDFDLFATTEPPGGWGISSVPLSTSDTVGIDDTHTFAFSITAPPGYTGAFSMRWSMRNRGELFGEELQVPSVLGGECPAGVERNACGGCSVLAAPPDNSPCRSCGKRVCSSDGDSVVCDDPGFTTPVQVANGVRFSCLRLASGGVRCWGDNSHGQLGDGTRTSRTAPAAPSLPGFSDVRAGWFHACGLTADRTVQCWGQGVVGQIGDGTSFDHATPTTVPGLNDVTQIAVASRHTCARVGTSAVYCWGYNGIGELGIGSTNHFETSPSPVSPATLPPPITYLAAGAQHTCAIASGKVYCWGDNWDGQLGIGVPPSVPQITRTPTTPVADLSDVTALAVGEDYSCALTGDGSVYCWGGNCTLTAWGNRHCAFDGVGGQRVSAPLSMPAKMLGLAKPAKAISVGSWMVCAILIDDTVQCWGANPRGGLGLGDTLDRVIPFTVPGLSGVLSVDNEELTTCAAFGAGSVACWGDNRWGQIGDGTLVDRLTPTPVAGASSICDLP